MLQMERNKHRQREHELIQQLEQAYAEAGGDRSITPIPTETGDERCNTPTPDGVKCRELEQQVSRNIIIAKYAELNHVSFS